MAKARKLKSGSWNIQVYDYTDQNNKRHYHSFTADTKAEVEFMAAKYNRVRTVVHKPKYDLTVLEAIERYIELSEVLSPTTLSSYEKIKKYAFQPIMNTKVRKLDDSAMQYAINMEAKRLSEKTGRVLSPKTIKNEYGLISAALKTTCDVTFRIRLPKYQKKVKEYPQPEEVLNAIRGSNIELPCLLAMWLSFSMSEVRGILCSSVKDGYIFIDRVLVDVDSKPVLKENAKVETRLRKHKIPPYLMQLIESTETYKTYVNTHQDGALIPLNRNQIYGRWQTICSHNNLALSFHDLRHLNASIMLMLNVPEKYAMERGGWKTPYVMKSVYQHTFSKERVKTDNQIDQYFDTLIN